MTPKGVYTFLMTRFQKWSFIIVMCKTGDKGCRNRPMDEKSNQALLAENKMLRQEIKVAREAADITARLVVKQFEKTEQMLQRFQAVNAQRQAVLDAATQLSIIATDLKGMITLFNRGAVNLLGFKASEMEGQRSITSIHVADELKRYALEMMERMPPKSDVVDLSESDAIHIFNLHVKQRTSQTREWTYIRKDGTHLPVTLSITAFYNVRGIMRGYLFTAMDMSRQKRMEHELIQAMKSAEAANASRGDFLARMSHEIRTPMNGILGMAHLMRKTQLSARQNDYLDKMLISATTLLNLINDILDFSKIDAGKLELESIAFNLEDVLASVISGVGHKAEEKNIEILFHLDSDVPYDLFGDPLRLSQVLMNLVSNAIKFTEKGKILISIRRDHDILDIDDVVLKISVQDSGIGLHPEQTDSLFDAFKQADDSITRKYGGTGLGLSICRQLTEMMGGRIWVESTLGEGATFIFTVRLKRAQVKKSGTPLPERKQMLQGRRALVVDDSRRAHMIEEIRGARILLVEDNLINQEVAEGFLRDAGIVVRMANNGKECLEMIEAEPFDLILMDIQMPVLDGLQTTRIIREKKKLRHLPIIAMTAHAMAGDREKSLDAGMNGHLNKPVDPVALYQILQQFIPKKKEAIQEEIKPGAAPAKKSGKREKPKERERYEERKKPAKKMIQMTKAEGVENPLTQSNVFCSQDAVTSCSPTKTSSGEIIPPLQGIDQPKALERLNDKPDILLSILNDFKQDYANHPQKLTELLNQERFDEIRIIAHTVKGICGYMGANALFNCAEKLENHLRILKGEIWEGSGDDPCRNASEKTAPFSPSPFMESGPGEEAKGKGIKNGDRERFHLVHLFINEMERILEGLDRLPPCQNKATPRHHDAIQPPTEKERERLLRFMETLEKGEVTAMEQLPEMTHLFRKWGQENTLETIEALMDDIEYEAAAMEVQRFLMKLKTPHDQ